MEWIDLAQDKDQWRGEHGNKPSGFIKYWEILEELSATGGFSRRTQLH
jgi:hypothetical protein